MLWSISPNLGSILNGVYTAPSTIASDAQVTITATSVANPAETALATVLLEQPVVPVGISVTPGSTTLNAGQAVQFKASVSGTSDTAVTWSLNPNLGSISHGVYSAPSNLSTRQTTTLTVTSQADPTKSASAQLVLMPALKLPPPPVVTISLSSGSASLTGGQSATFTPTVTGSSNKSVTWSINPQVGTITNGVYQAPAIVGSQHSVTVSATSGADPTKTATATVSLIPVGVTVGPATASLGVGKSATFAASVTGTGNTAVTWSFNPALGTLVNGVYTAPGTIASAQTVAITAASIADPSKTATATVTLKPTSTGSNSGSGNQNSGSGNPASTTVTLPLEVMGPGGTTGSASFTVPSGANLNGQLTLWMQIHGLKYDAEASVQVNKSGWLPLSTGNVTLLGLAAAYGGIGGGFHTLQLTLNLPAGSVVAGTNTITFRFNGTDGVVSGYRVLAFNIQSAGANLLPSSVFVNEDPDTWQPPSNIASDITTGQTLWHNAALTVPTPAGTVSIQAHCADCHSEDGRDLKYFNYSNNSIQVRSVFHGLTATQGNQIASYIRSLNVPNPGRPWNPPYQPGPGLDSQPVTNWSAGAGLSAILDSDADMQPYMLPGGSSAGWSAHAYLNVRELPIALQLPDWNSWLPIVHPKDAFGASFTNNGLNTYYLQLHNMLQPNSPASYNQAMGPFENWFVAGENYIAPMVNNMSWDATTRTNVYSLALWRLVKQWELNQEFGLEGMPQVPYGSTADSRGWYSNAAFSASPIMLKITAGPGLANGSAAVREYLAYIWYHMQLLLNDGQGHESGNSPIDFSYTENEAKDLSQVTGTPAASLELMWMVKSLQEFTLNGLGPQYGSGTGGFVPTAVSPIQLVFGKTSEWSATSPSTELALTTDYVSAWFAESSSFTPQDYYKGSDGSGVKWASPTENPATDSWTVFGGQVWYLLPRLRYLGVDSSLVNRISAWAATVWPAGNWALNNSATCSDLAGCSSDDGK